MISVISILGALAIFVLAGAIVVARRVIADRPRRSLRLLAADDRAVTVPATMETLAAGTYGIWYDNFRSHAVIGAVLENTGSTVTREVLKVSGSSLQGVQEAVWTGQVIRSPECAGDSADIVIAGARGTVSAWMIRPAASISLSSTWAIHVHGIRSSREGSLRSVPSALALGMTSLVITFVGYADAEAGRRPPASLGASEWKDVDAAVEYAVQNGAERVVLFGWSMGASAALLTAERSAHRDRVAGLVLIGPATSWRRIIVHAARKAHLPGFAGHLACWVLGTPLVSRLAGAPSTIPIADLDWTTRRRIEQPILVIHSAGDEQIPLTFSKQFIATHARNSYLAELPSALHCSEYNVAPNEFDSTVARWWRESVLSK
jgi:hypothetical protein